MGHAGSSSITEAIHAICAILTLTLAWTHPSWAASLDGPSQTSGGPVTGSTARGRVGVGDPVVGVSTSTSRRAAMGTVVRLTPALLGVKVDPGQWRLKAPVNVTKVTTADERVKVLNIGETPLKLALNLVAPQAWTAGSKADVEQCALNGLITGKDDAPQSGDFGDDDVITSSLQTAGAAKFGYAGAAAHGGLVGVEQQRAIWLKLATPTRTKAMTEQAIEVIVTAEVP